jgi:fatty-acyl-CoA synthase
VEECAVFGVDDAKWGEAVHAAVVLRAKHHVTGEQLVDWVKAELGSVKAPKRIWFVDHLERNAAGKVSRAAVRASLVQP